MKEIIDEYHLVLRREKFSFSESAVNAMLGAIERPGVSVRPTATGEVLPDMKDLPFYEAAFEKQDSSTYLVTGNIKHFPSKPFIVTAKQMLDIIDK